MKLTVAFASLLGLLTIAAVAVLVFDFGREDNPADGLFNAGPQSDYAPGSITHLEAQRIYLVRLAGGDFVAMYDWGPRAQMSYENGEAGARDCRVAVYTRGHDTTRDDQWYEQTLEMMRSQHEPVEGLEDTVLSAACYGASLFDPLGRRSFGPSDDLDRFQLVVDSSGDVIIDLNDRHCKEYSPCLPYM